MPAKTSSWRSPHLLRAARRGAVVALRWLPRSSSFWLDETGLCVCCREASPSRSARARIPGRSPSSTVEGRGCRARTSELASKAVARGVGARAVGVRPRRRLFDGGRTVAATTTSACRSWVLRIDGVPYALASMTSSRAGRAVRGSRRAVLLTAPLTFVVRRDVVPPLPVRPRASRHPVTPRRGDAGPSPTRDVAVYAAGRGARSCGARVAARPGAAVLLSIPPRDSREVLALCFRFARARAAIGGA